MRCPCCGSEHTAPAFHAVVKDAAQMYEVIPRAQIIADAQTLLGYLQTDQGVLVRHEPPLRGYVCRKPRIMPQKCSWFDGPTLLGFVLITLQQDIATCGGFLWTQKAGIPIGGIFSSVLANLILALAEQRKTTSREFCMRFTLPGTHLSSAFFPARNEGGLLLVTKCLCTACLASITDLVYPISFDTADQGSKVLWTDMLIITSREHEIQIIPKQNEIPQYFNDLLLEKYNMSIPPFLNMFTKPVTVLRSTLAGRLTRLNQISLDDYEFLQTVTTDLLRWCNAGYPPRILAHVWSTIRVRRANEVRKFLMHMCK